MDIENQINEVKRNFPLLVFSPEKNEFLGEIFISQTDSYQIRIDLGTYPKNFPNVYETAERIPNKPDRHIYTNTEGCCLTTNARAQILLKTKIRSLNLFIKDILIPYLQNNSYFEIHRKYKTSEYNHHHQGVVDSYKDILLINNELLIARVITYRLLNQKLKIHDLCYCESGEKLKKCSRGAHDKAYRDFKLIDKELLEFDIQQNFYPLLKCKEILK